MTSPSTVFNLGLPDEIVTNEMNLNMIQHILAVGIAAGVGVLSYVSLAFGLVALLFIVTAVLFYE